MSSPLYDLKTKEQSKCWTRDGSPCPKKFKTCSQTIGGEYYPDVLDSLKTAVIAKGCAKITKDMLLQHDHASVYTCQLVVDAVRIMVSKFCLNNPAHQTWLLVTNSFFQHQGTSICFYGEIRKLISELLPNTPS